MWENQEKNMYYFNLGPIGITLFGDNHLWVIRIPGLVLYKYLKANTLVDAKVEAITEVRKLLKTLMGQLPNG